ncbi:glycosyltransferase family 2 protein [Geodermatophilus sp. DSM 44513]|uniref:glycosyltransferase n=1 Tax=Geodermatophilus sp. DSM 44513 TaxID=1528104 RepID=UPI001282C656|nr:glycosyltransferase family 2 protein [Geodermatophilus sp. DSM 44513]WNV76006.1 glycosyltransferase family 2 protein [Geodermatophilus sp. DSM 44513]
MSTPGRPRASIVIPAHEEAAVIGRCLDSLLAGAHTGELEVVVVANGCRDATVEIVRGYAPRVQMLELVEGSKPAALNAGDEVLQTFPRLYMDADVELTIEAVRSVIAVLTGPHALIATPRRALQLRGVTLPVRLYLKTWEALQRARGETIGTGVYAVNEAGRRRFDHFPDCIGDDRFVHDHFDRSERLLTEPAVKVWPPKDMAELVRVRTRVRLGNTTTRVTPLKKHRPPLSAQVLSLAKEPTSLVFAPLYLLVTLLIRARARRMRDLPTVHWERAERRPE